MAPPARGRRASSVLGPPVLLLALLGLPVSCKRLHRGGVDAGLAPDAGEAPFPAQDAAADASMYRAPTDGFEVEFPEGKAPEVEDKPLPKGVATARLFKVQYGSSAYLVVAEDVQTSANRTVDQLLQGAREGAVETTGSTIVSDTPLKVGAYRGFELVLTATTSGLTMRQRVRVLASPSRLYQLLVVAPEWSGSTPLEQRFFDSFQPGL